MPLSMDNPTALILLLLLPALYLVGRRRLARMAPWRGRAVLAARLLSVLAIVLALAGPSIPMRDASMSVAFVLDRSGSVSDETRARQEEWVRQAMSEMRSTDRSAVVAFDETAQITRGLSGEKDYRPSPLPSGGEAGTNVAEALRLASGLLPVSGLKKVVLFSDGWETEAGAEGAVSALPDGTRLEVVPQGTMEGLPEVLIESLQIPPYLREGDSFDVSAVVDSSHEGSAEMRMKVDTQQTGSWTVQLGPGANLVTMPNNALPLGFHSIELELLAGGDTVAENNRAGGFVVVKERGRVLLVEGAESSGNLPRQMEEAGLRVDRVAGSDLPNQMSQLLQYDGIVMNDVPGPSLSLDQTKALESYVKDQGRGLVVLGGRSSFGLGDYASSLLEEMLPVSSNVPLTRDRVDMALLLIMDRSGSMDDTRQGANKMAMAREAAAQAVQMLRPEDQIGILVFDTDPQWVVPVEKVGDRQQELLSRINRIQSSGGTDIFGALQAGYNHIKDIKASQKHILLLSDGQSWKGNYEGLIERMKPYNITLSTVAIGADADSEYLSSLARLGEGRFYLTQRFTDMPQIVYREVSVATRVSEVEGQVQPAFVTPSPVLRGLRPEEMPPLSGYVATRLKDAATVVLRSERGDPLLAQWQYGLGRVVAWTSDAEGLWSGEWTSRPEFSKIWEQAIRWTMAPPIDQRLRLSTEVKGGRATVTADAVDQDGLFVNLAETRVQLTHADGSREIIPMTQVSPGRYQATVLATKPGLFRVDVVQTREGQQALAETGGYVVPWAREFRRLGSNEALMKRMAAATGGGAIASPGQAFSRQGMPSTPGWEPVWPYLIALSLLLLPVEVALRRVRQLPLRKRREEDAPPVSLERARAEWVSRAESGSSRRAA